MPFIGTFQSENHRWKERTPSLISTQHLIHFKKQHHASGQTRWRKCNGLELSYYLFGPGGLAVINETINSAVYQKLLSATMAISLYPQAEALSGYAAGQWSETSRYQQIHLNGSENKMRAVQWPSQSPVWNPIEMIVPKPLDSDAKDSSPVRLGHILVTSCY